MQSCVQFGLWKPNIGYVQINYKLKTDLQCCMVGKGLSMCACMSEWVSGLLMEKD